MQKAFASSTQSFKPFVFYSFSHNFCFCHPKTLSIDDVNIISKKMFDEKTEKFEDTEVPTRSLFMAMQSTLLLPAGDDDDLLDHSERSKMLEIVM